MSSKAKSDVKVLKGQEAEDKVLEYLKKMNRPYGAVDAAVQKILVSLAERGELVQKTYGKMTFFVANQAKIESLPAEMIASLEAEIKTVKEENASLALEAKAKTAVNLIAPGIAIDETLNRLGPLRTGAPLISPEERKQIQGEWLKWRAEWVRRRKVFMTFWQLVTDALTPQDAERLADELGIEWDSGEHAALERTALCERKVTGILKRKRE
ncbi:hypothetical protein F5887DRAFT_952569 [Amanita rubescens]|nr:hypothetical protein F5887DRAFT_952569 [Amanita rubescens]